MGGDYKVWSGRFSEGASKSLEEFNASIGFDWVLYSYDIRGSIAWAEALRDAGILTDEELLSIKDGLSKVEKEIREGKLEFSPSLEDIHMHIEKRLYELIGEPAKKLHTGRSRNDQVALDLRMYVKDKADEALKLLRDLMFSLVKKADELFGVIAPSYTHLQRAQPVLLSHYFLAYFEMFKRDRIRFLRAYEFADVLPLGSGAATGTTVPVDRELLARKLGFRKVSSNSLDAVSDRDFIVDFIYACSMTLLHLSRLSEELVIWSSQEFSFVEIPDRYATGSSMMPQKKNPDIPELVRAKSARAASSLMGILMLIKALPLSYNKDLQEDKIYLFDAAETVLSCLSIMAEMVPQLVFKKDRISKALYGGFLAATDLADYFVKRGVPFRKAHDMVGRIVSHAMEKNKELNELTIDELKAFFPQVDKEVYNFLDPERCVERRSVIGGTSPDRVREEIERAYVEIEGF